MVAWSLLPPTPPWITIAPTGLLSVGVSPIAGYSGLVRVKAVDGADVAVVDIPIAIQPAYTLALDYLEIFEAVWVGGFGSVFDSIELEPDINYQSGGLPCAVYADLDLGGVGAGEFEVVITGVAVEVESEQVIVSPIVATVPAIFTTTIDFEMGLVTVESIPLLFTSVFTFDAQLSIAYTQVMAYTVLHQRQSASQQPIVSLGTWANLNDQDNLTGAYIEAGNFARLVINLGSPLTIREIRLDGGMYNFGLDLLSNMNGLDLQYSSGLSGPWTTFTIVSGINDAAIPVIYNPNITAQYWRLADDTNPGLAACTSMFEFYT